MQTTSATARIGGKTLEGESMLAIGTSARRIYDVPATSREKGRHPATLERLLGSWREIGLMEPPGKGGTGTDDGPREKRKKKDTACTDPLPSSSITPV